MIIIPGFQGLLHTEEIPDCMGIIMFKGSRYTNRRAIYTGRIKILGFEFMFKDEPCINYSTVYEGNITRRGILAPFKIGPSNGYLLIPQGQYGAMTSRYPAPNSITEGDRLNLGIVKYLPDINFDFHEHKDESLVKSNFLAMAGREIASPRMTTSNAYLRLAGRDNPYENVKYFVTGFKFPRNSTELRQLKGLGINIFLAEELSCTEPYPSGIYTSATNDFSVSDILLRKAEFVNQGYIRRTMGFLPTLEKVIDYKNLFSRKKSSQPPLFLSVQGPDGSGVDRWFKLDPREDYVDLATLSQGVEPISVDKLLEEAV